MIRLTLLSVVVGFVAIYAWRDWYRALCGLIVMMAFLEHRDMPRTMFGILGLNPWNLLLAIIVLAWMTQRRREGLRWDMPGSLTFMLLLYLGVVVVGVARLIADPKGLHSATAGLVNEYLLNTVKYAVPGLLLFDGCRSRERFLWAICAMGLLYLLLGLQVIRWMPPTSAFLPDFANRAARVLRREVGYHRVNLSVMLAAASWSILAVCPLVRTRKHQLLIVSASLVVLLAQLLTGGRGGYLGWAVAGFVLGLVRWPRYLLLVPVAALALFVLLPGVVDRTLQGLEGDKDTEDVDVDRLTAGRATMWPIIVAKIGDSPITGYGRAAMERTGLIRDESGGAVRNPHSAYLEILLDSGWLGLLAVLVFFVSVLVRALSVLRDTRSPMFAAAGASGAASLITFLVGSITGQSFYPGAGALGMWCAIGLLVRVWVQRARVLAAAPESARVLTASAPEPGAEAVAVWWGRRPDIPLDVDATLWEHREPTRSKT